MTTLRQMVEEYREQLDNRVWYYMRLARQVKRRGDMHPSYYVTLAKRHHAHRMLWLHGRIKEVA